MHKLVGVVASLFLCTSYGATLLEDVCLLRFVMSREKVSSVRCLSCHDGTVGPAIHGAMQPFGVVEAAAYDAQALGSHPVEVDYGVAQLARPGVLAAPTSLPDALVFNEGKMTCMTCHDGASPPPARLAVTVEHSELCHTCHAGY